MADNLTTTTTVSTVPSGTVIATDDVGGAQYQRVKMHWGPNGTANETDSPTPLPASLPASALCTGSVTRPADTNAYAADDEWSSSTSAPGVTTITGCARVVGGGGSIQSALLHETGYSATPAQFEVWLFDTTTTPNNDNAAFAPSPTVGKTAVCVIQFNISSPGTKTASVSGNRLYFGTIVSGNGKFKCAGGSTSLYARFKVLNAYTPIASEVLDLRLFIDQD